MAQGISKQLPCCGVWPRGAHQHPLCCAECAAALYALGRAVWPAEPLPSV